MKILDSRGDYLSSGQAVAGHGGDPAGGGRELPGRSSRRRRACAGARTNPDRKDTTEGSTTMGGDWKLLGGTEATVASASEDCGR